MAENWHVGVKMRTGGMTFFVLEAASEREASDTALSLAIERGYPASHVIMCNEVRHGTHHLLAPFGEPAAP